MAYAENTKVPVAQSKAEITEMLKKIGANQVGTMESDAEQMVVFRCNDVMYRISAPVDQSSSKPEQRNKAVWRAIVLLVKAKKVAIDQGITTVEREFLSDTVMPDGSSMMDHAPAIIEHHYKEIGAPKLLMLK